MRSKFHHEEIYRGKNLLKVLAETEILICGAGAIGSNLVDNLTRQGFQRLHVIDMDRVESHNLNTQIWSDNDVGSLKVDALRNKVFRNVGTEIEVTNKEMTASNAAKFIKKASLVVDAFDNNKSRQLIQDEVRKLGIPCLHAGLHPSMFGEVIYDEFYHVPQDVGGDVCDYPLARNLILLTVAILTEEILDFCLSKPPRYKNWSVTLKDLKVSEMKLPTF